MATAAAPAPKEASEVAPATLDAHDMPVAGTAVLVMAEKHASPYSQPSPTVEASQEAMNRTPRSPVRGTPGGRGTSIYRTKQKPWVTASGKAT